MAKKKVSVDLPPIVLEAFGTSPEEQSATLESAFELPGYPSMCMMLVDLILRRADIAVFDYSQNAVAIKYQIDGLWHPMAPMDRENGDFLLFSLKQIGGANPEERRARQEALFRGVYENRKFKFRCVSQGVSTGERVAIYVDFKRPALDTLSELGARAGIKDQLIPILNGDQKLVITAALPGEGHSLLWRATLGAADRFTRDFYVIEDQNQQEEEIINVGQVTFNSAKQEDAFTPMRGLLLRQPNVIAFSELSPPPILGKICNLIGEADIQAMSRIHAKSAVEALSKLMALQPDLKTFSECVGAILAMRVVRKLCEKCRLAFPPSAPLLKSLAIPPGRVRQLYRSNPFQAGLLDERGNELPPCSNCLGTGFFGRTGLFELLIPDASIRKAIAGNASATTLGQIIANSNNVSMREEAVLLIAKGVTSTEEIQRVLSK